MKQFNELNEIEKKQRSKDRVKNIFSIKNILMIFAIIAVALVLAIIFANIYSSNQQKRLEAMQQQSTGGENNGNSIAINFGNGGTNSNRKSQDEYMDFDFELLGTEKPKKNAYYLDTYFKISNPNEENVKLWIESISFNGVEVKDTGNFDLSGKSEVVKEIAANFKDVIANQVGDTIDSIQIVYYLDHYTGETKIYEASDLGCVLGEYEDNAKNGTGSNSDGVKESKNKVTSGGDSIPSRNSEGPDSKDFSVDSFVRGWYDRTDGDYSYYYILAITNNSEYIVSVDGNAVAKNKDGKSVGAASSDITVLGPGETSYMELTFFSMTEDVTDFEYSLSYEEETLFKPVIKDIELDVTENSKNVIISATNKGTETAGGVSAYVIFMDKDDKVVDANMRFLTDDDSEIKPGATTVTQIDADEEFDHAKVFLAGRVYD